MIVTASQPPSFQQIATLRPQARFATLRPAIDRVLSELSEPVYVLDVSERGCRVRRDRNPCYTVSPACTMENGPRITSYASIPAGLVPVVQHLLAKRQIRFETLPDMDLSEIGPPDFNQLLRNECPDREFPEFLGRVPAGLVLHPTQRVDPHRLIMQAVRTYPQAKIVIATRRIQDARALARHLRQGFNDVQLMVDTWESCKSKRIVVALYDKLGFGSVQIEQRDLFFALHAEEVLSAIGSQAYPHIAKARLFGFLPWDANLAPGDECRLAEWFGLERLIVPEHGKRLRDVQFAFVRSRGTVLSSATDNLQVRREGIWENENRNLQVSELAAAIERRDPSFVLPNNQPVLPLLPRNRRPGVLIVARSGAQITAIRRQLPNWGQELEVPNYFDSDETTRNRLPARSILATHEITQQELADVDVVIRADGGVGLPVPVEALLDPVEVRRNLLVIDFADRGHPVLRNWSRQRRDMYRRHEWCEVGIEMTAQRAERWLELSQ